MSCNNERGANQRAGLLHVTNGDTAANLISSSNIGGRVLPWRDPMHHGPFPGNYSLDEVSRIRLAYLSGDESCASLIAQNRLQELGCSTSAELNGFEERNQRLSGPSLSEIVFWFEHDLLDQLQLLQLLDFFAHQQSTAPSLSMVCIDEFDGIDNFRGLGQLSTEQIASLLPHKTPVTSQQLDVASKGWAAFCHNSPIELQSFLESNQTELPFLNNALRRHCQEYPWISDGLSRTERQLLGLIKKGVDRPEQLFVQNMENESALFIGDSRTYSHLKMLCQEPVPLVLCNGGANFVHPYEQSADASTFNEQRFQLSEFGEQLLAGSGSAATVREYDCWLGGVHLQHYQGMWFWDDQGGQFTYWKH